MDFRLVSRSSVGCHICQALRQCPRKPQRPLSAISASLQLPRTPQRPQRRQASARASAQVFGRSQHAQAQSSSQQRLRRLSEQDSRYIQSLVDRVLQHPAIPPKTDTVDALKAIEDYARQLLGVQNDASTKARKQPAETTPASTLLSLDSRPSQPKGPAPPSENITFLSTLAHELLIHEPVDITPTLLTHYVQIQTLLSRPQSLPEIFTLYASKPTPTTSPKTPKDITYTPTKPNAIATAIPPNLANLALDSALKVRHLPTALEIIETTFRRPAFQRSKLFRRALPPLALASLFPVAVYKGASQFAHSQTLLPPEDFTQWSVAGLITYIIATGSIGYVAITTRNDQMERVTWVVGTPLWERWAREEERAACDKVALEWGFREKWRWGEEEGREWEVLKEWLGLRGMVLDKVSLMEGME